MGVFIFIVLILFIASLLWLYDFFETEKWLNIIIFMIIFILGYLLGGM